MPKKKVILTGLVTLLGVGGLITGAVLIRERQNLERSAAVPGGRAEVRILPAGGNFEVGETIPVSVYFNTDGVAVNGVSVRITYPYTSGTPEIVTSDLEINPTLLSSGNWSCPTKTIQEDFNVVNIDISCADISASGFSTSTDTLLATFNLDVNSAPSANPFVVKFDTSKSVITQKSDGQDILGIPDSTGSYTVGGAPVATSTPAASTATPTVSTTPSVTSSLTPSPTSVFMTSTPTGTSVSTSSATLPDAGVSLPTMLGLGIGIIALFGAFALAL